MPQLDLSAGGPVVVSIGGSMIVSQDVPDAVFLTSLRELVQASPRQLVIITGGGKTARNYQAAGAQVRNLVPDELDWIGIYATRINAQLVRITLGDMAFPDVVIDPEQTPVRFEEKVLVGAGFKPGNSSDLMACQMAKKIGARVVVNVSNVDHVYTDDPKKNPKAKPVDEMSWDDYLQIIPSEWTPGLSTPFDPVASRFCRDAGMQVAMVSGSDIKNLQKLIAGEPFLGSVLR